MNIDPMTLYWIIPLIVLELVGKGFALWRAAKNNNRNWYIALLIINTAGILPLIYLKFFSKKSVKSKK